MHNYTQWAKIKENTYVPHKELYRVIHGLGDPICCYGGDMKHPSPFKTAVSQIFVKQQLLSFHVHV